MAAALDTYYFDNIPSIETIYQQLNENTGLEIVMEGPSPEDIEGTSSYLFSHPRLKSGFFLTIYTDKIEIFYGVRLGKLYLPGAIAHTLTQLGGEAEYPCDIPKWAKTKWDERKWWQSLK